MSTQNTAPDNHTPEPWQANRFSNINGEPHTSNTDVAETLRYSAMQSESAELFGASKDELVVFYTGNGPRSKLNAMRIVACVNACAGMQDPAAEIEAMRAAHSSNLIAYEELQKCEQNALAELSISNDERDHYRRENEAMRVAIREAHEALSNIASVGREYYDMDMGPNGAECLAHADVALAKLQPFLS